MHSQGAAPRGIVLATCLLSSGRYDVFFLRVRKVRGLIRRALNEHV